jgi:hypothetical protein
LKILIRVFLFAFGITIQDIVVAVIRGDWENMYIPWAIPSGELRLSPKRFNS